MFFMITKEQFVQNLVREIDIIKHLAEKVDSTKLDYRPTEKQRSTLELLQYLGQMVHTGVSAYIAGDQALYVELSKNKDAVTFENFISKMDEQSKFAEEAIGALSEEDMKRESTIWGTTAPLALQLLGVLKNVVAYKMQLFLYIKACGNANIGTSNLWAGVDMPPKE
jgi:Zn-dependent oligopeptidase